MKQKTQYLELYQLEQALCLIKDIVVIHLILSSGFLVEMSVRPIIFLIAL